MKFIFLIVLLANISFFLWEYNSPYLYSTLSNKTRSKQKLKTIFLLNEVAISAENNTSLPVSQLKPVLPEQLNARKGAKKTEAGELHLPEHQEQLLLPKQTFCYEIGPFKDEESMNQWLTLNKNTISHFLQIEKNSPINPRYLVYSPATGNFEQSKKNITLFQKMGVDEFWMFRKGELEVEGAISFGLFSKENRALDLQNKLSKKGLETKILHTEMTKTLLYLQIYTEKERLKSIFNANNKPVIANCESN